MASERYIFRGTPEKLPVASRIYQVEGAGGRLVREVPLWNQRAINVVKKTKKTFEELRDEYNLSVPNIHLVIGTATNDDKEAMFMVVDRVFGTTLRDFGDLTVEIAPMFDIFFSNLTRALSERYTEGKAFFYDVGLRNLMYGHRLGETKDAIYISDVGPEGVAFPENEDRAVNARQALDDIMNGIGVLARRADGDIHEAELFPLTVAAIEKTKQALYR